MEEPCERNNIGLGKPPSKDNSPDDGIVIKVGNGTHLSYFFNYLKIVFLDPQRQESVRAGR